jgi:hypothetical protein
MEILAVIVRYQTPLEQSATLRGVRQVLADDPGIQGAIGVLVWDNSPQRLADPALPAGVDYRHSPANIGVSGAYNEAAHIATRCGATWMLLLDQDTTLPRRFLQNMLAESRAMADRGEIAAIVPVVKVGDRIVSPRRSIFNGHREYSETNGVGLGEAFAINSGCLLRLTALAAIGGFSKDFWLDYSDRYIFHQFYLRGFCIARANVELQHEMTILDYDRLMSPWRYKNFIEAESAFNDLYKSPFENAVQTLRLAIRVVRQKVRYKNPQFSRITLSHLWKRVTKPQKRRLAEWKSAQSARQTAR